MEVSNSLWAGIDGVTAVGKGTEVKETGTERAIEIKETETEIMIDIESAIETEVEIIGIKRVTGTKHTITEVAAEKETGKEAGKETETGIQSLS